MNSVINSWDFCVAVRKPFLVKAKTINLDLCFLAAAAAQELTQYQGIDIFPPQ